MKLLLTLLLLPSLALAFGERVRSGGSGDVTAASLATQAAISLYVDSTGSDSNVCTASGVSACLTIQGALAKLPKLIRHPVSITVGGGTFAGAFVQGFTFDATHDPTSGAHLYIQGTRETAAVATGTATGTLTAASAGTASTTTRGTATDGSQSWTVNDLKGKWLRITGGTGSGQIRVIESNTATAITIVGVWSPAPAAGSTYAIESMATTINSGVAWPKSGETAATSNFAAFWVEAGGAENDGADMVEANLQITDFAVSTSRGVRFTASSAMMNVKRIRFTGTSTFAQVMGESSTLTISDIYQSAGRFVSGSDPMSTIQSSRNLIVTTASVPVTTAWASSAKFVENTWEVSATTNIVDLSAAFPPRTVGIRLAGVKLTCSAAGTGIGVNGASNLLNGVSLTVVASDISGCAAAINIRGSVSADLTTVTGTGNTTALSVNQGARLRINAATTLTGTTEISIDGTTMTLAALRALTPKQSTNATTLSTVFEF